MKTTITDFTIDRKAHTVTAGSQVYDLIACCGNYWIAKSEGKDYHLFPKGDDHERAMLLIDVSAFTVIECSDIEPVFSKKSTAADWLFSMKGGKYA